MNKFWWELALAPGAAIGACMVYWLFLSAGYLVLLLDIVATCAALALIGELGSGMYWGFTGHVLSTSAQISALRR